MNALSFIKIPWFTIKSKKCYRSAKNIVWISSQGFSLLELIVIIAIIGILASIAVPAYYSFIEKARVTRAISEIGTLQGEILGWQGVHGTLPLSLDEIGRGGLMDPWGNPYQYLNFDTVDEKATGKEKEKGKDEEKKRKDHNLHPINDDFDLYSMGKDGDSKAPLTAKVSRDDIIRANNGAYIGIASKY